MGHNADLIVMGGTPSSDKTVKNYAGDPATFKAGLCVHQKSDGTLSLASADGAKIGISLGKSLSGTKRVPVCTDGENVPVLLANGFTPTKGAQVQISTTTGMAVASGTAVNAFYASGKMSAIDEAGESIADGAALINMVGGL